MLCSRIFLHMYVWERGSIELLFGEGSAWNAFHVLENKLLKHAVKQSRNVLCCITAGYTRDCCSEVDIFIMECEMEQPQCHSTARMPCCHKPRSPPECPSNCSLSLSKTGVTQLYSCRLNVALWVTGWSSDLWNRKCSFKLLQLQH